MMSKLIKTVMFDAPPETVWSFLTNKDKLGEWYHPAEDHLAEGQDYKLLGKTDDGAAMTLIWGRVLEWEKPSRLVTTFCIAPFEGRETKVTWELSQAQGGTLLRLTHENVPEAAGENALSMLMALDKGWDEHLGDLRKSANA